MLVAVALMFAGAFTHVYAEKEGTADTDKYAEPPKIKAKSAILIDAKTGDVLYSKKADAKREPASCTKILTALLAIENLDPEEIITVTEESYGVEGSSVGLVPDEQIKADDLLYATLLESGNDAATALAVGIDGSVGKFAQRMNERVEQMGLTQSHFTNPHGLPDPEHYTTARNLAHIAREAMQNERFRKYVSTYEYTMPKTNIQPKRILHNSNRMLYDETRSVSVYGEKVSVKYPGITGIKTGYTIAAGSCLVSGISRDGLELISVILKSEGMNQYSDTIGLLEYGLHNFEETTFLKKGDAMFERPVVDSEDAKVNIVLAEDLMATVNRNEISSLYVDGEVTEATTDGALTAPVRSGDVLGKAWVKKTDGQTLATVDLIAGNTVEIPASKGIIPVDDGVGTLSLVLRLVGLACLIAVVIVVIAIIRASIHRRRRRRNRMYGANLNNAVDTREVRRIKNINGTGGRKR
jgi:D-alanyl-D-alanine carboxypeptidase (penicillin-binding protein 5/6)